jgi:integrase
MLSVTVDEAIAIYLREYLVHRAPKTQYQQRLVLRVVSQEFGLLPLAALTPTLVRAWRDRLATRLSCGTVRYYLQTLSALCRMGVEDYDWLEENPLSRVRKPPQPAGRTRCLSPEELQRLLGACRRSANPALGVIVLTALGTGARKMEILSLHWSQVDMALGVIRLPTSKNGEPRPVPVPRRVLEVLAQWGTTRRLLVPWVFPNVKGTGPMDIGGCWRSAVTRAQVPNFHFHDLRHTTASYLAMSGASVREIAEVLGHKSLTMSFKYIHLTVGHTRAILERMADFYLPLDQRSASNEKMVDEPRDECLPGEPESGSGV